MLIDQIKTIAKEAGKIMLEACDPKIMEKSGHANYCTQTDEKIQAFLIERLKAVMPEAEYLGWAVSFVGIADAWLPPHHRFPAFPRRTRCRRGPCSWIPPRTER